MTDSQLQLVKKAIRSVESARHSLSGGYPEHAVGRAYFAMFYVVQAFLEGEGMAFSKHSAVISAFGQHFARAGRVPREFHRYIIKAEELRRQGDYWLDLPGKEEAEEQISHAQEFLELAERLIGPLPPEE